MGLVTGCCLIGALTVGYGAWKLDRIHRDRIALNEVADGAPSNYLVVGSDSRGSLADGDPNGAAFGASPGARSDTIMVMRVDPHNAKVSLLSLPRDLWLPIAGHSMNERINAAYGFGKQTLVDTVKPSSRSPSTTTSRSTSRGSRGWSTPSAASRCTSTPPCTTRTRDLEINATGCTVLDGSQALAFARARDLNYETPSGRITTDGTGDLGRIAASSTSCAGRWPRRSPRRPTRSR